MLKRKMNFYNICSSEALENVKNKNSEAGNVHTDIQKGEKQEKKNQYVQLRKPIKENITTEIKYTYSLMKGMNDFWLSS